MSEPAQEPAVTFDEFPKVFQITERVTGRLVLASCVPLTRELAHERIDKKWWVGLPCSKQVRRDEPDYSWKWVDLLGDLRKSKRGGYVRGWAVEVEGEAELQGAILYRIDAVSFHRNPDGTTNPAVYGEYLATAPRNRGRLTAPEPGRFRGVGRGLLKLAVAHSHYLNGEGLVNLSSVNHPDTISLYRRFGFFPVASLPEDTLVVMELAKEAATKYLREMGLQ